ncbi:hypothetical protein TNCV_2804361 [Trichonephila clavipes]|nr:hypothetical protein TNCV_2804361 [Trichonephila clavipes]
MPECKLVSSFPTVFNCDKKIIAEGFGPTVYSIPSMGHFLKSRIYRDVTRLRYIVQPCLLFTTPAFFVTRSDLFSPVVARSSSLYRLSFDLLPGQLRDSPGNVFKDMTYFHTCKVTRPLTNKTGLRGAWKATAVVLEKTDPRQRLWHDLPQEVIGDLNDSMPRHVSACIAI